MVISAAATDSDENLYSTFASRYARTALPRYVFFSMLLSFLSFLFKGGTAYIYRLTNMGGGLFKSFLCMKGLI